MNQFSAVININRVEKAMARNRVYALLALGFRYPGADTFSRFADGTYAQEIAQALELCAAEMVAPFQENIAPGLQAVTSCQELEAAYIGAFETNMPQPSVSLYEGSHHLHGNKPGLLLELKSFYSNFGLAMAESENELEDALSAELEFMQFLTAKQVQAEEGVLDRVPYLRAQRDFLQRHLVAWLPVLQAEVESKLKHPFYRALGVLANDFVAFDAGVVGDDAACLNA